MVLIAIALDSSSKIVRGKYIGRYAVIDTVPQTYKAGVYTNGLLYDNDALVIEPSSDQSLMIVKDGSYVNGVASGVVNVYQISQANWIALRAAGVQSIDQVIQQSVLASHYVSEWDNGTQVSSGTVEQLTLSVQVKFKAFKAEQYLASFVILS